MRKAPACTAKPLSALQCSQVLPKAQKESKSQRVSHRARILHNQHIDGSRPQLCTALTLQIRSEQGEHGRTPSDDFIGPTGPIGSNWTKWVQFVPVHFVLDHTFLKLHFLFAGVCVVEADDEFALAMMDLSDLGDPSWPAFKTCYGLSQNVSSLQNIFKQ